MRANSSYRQFASVYRSRNHLPVSAVKRFFNVATTWLTTALLVGLIWGFCYLVYMLLLKELA